MTTLISNGLSVMLELTKVTISKHIIDILKYVVEQSLDGVNFLDPHCKLVPSG